MIFSLPTHYRGSQLQPFCFSRFPGLRAAGVALSISTLLVQPGIAKNKQNHKAVATAPTENPSAYIALRAIKQEFGDDALKNIIEVNGREGVPQPYIWRVTMLDKAQKPVPTPPKLHTKSGQKPVPDTLSNAKLREVDIADGKIVGQRKLNRTTRMLVGVPLDFQSLNLDSSGAFNLADTQARKMNLSFDALNYTLRANPSGKPIWTLQILDSERDDLGSISIAATDASIINATGKMAVQNISKPDSSDTKKSQSTTTQQSKQTTRSYRSRPSSGIGGLFERSGRTLDKTGKSVKSSFHKTGETIEGWFSHDDDKRSRN